MLFRSRHELGLMAKISSNEMAAKFSRELGLKQIQQVLDSMHFYDTNHGGGIWVGKHYGQGSERYGDPVANNSHAATVRQLLRFFLLLEQEKLQRFIEGLKTPDHAQAAAELVQRGAGAIGSLLAALERRDVELRRQALAVLQTILKRPIAFDPYAPEALRKQQLASLREQCERKAG